MAMPSKAMTQYGALPAAATDDSHPTAARKVFLGAATAALVLAACVVASQPFAPTPAAHLSTSLPLRVVESQYAAAAQVQPIAHADLGVAVTAGASSYIHVDTSRVFQEILGFGGAFTEAAALQFAKLSPALQAEVLRLYFDAETGAGYTIGRVPMNSCDFSPASYSFDDVVNDTALLHFDTNVTHDQATIIPFLRAAQTLQPQLKLFLSPWSPPAWMKLPNAHGVQTMTSSVEPNGLHPDFRASWALYFSKFISAYKAQGLPFWGLTPQNEPLFAAPWEACAYTADAQADFIANFLGPRLRADHPEVKIMVYDFIRDAVADYARVNYAKAAEFVDGVATHWYAMGGRELDGVMYHTELNLTHFEDPTKFILSTESCNCPDVASGKDGWFRGQRYAHDILGNLNNWAVGWVDWNLLLDHKGGPNHLANTCDAPLVLTPDETSFVVQPMYYFITHFSRFIPPGSKRIAAHVHVTYDARGDDALFADYPAGLYACDKSARQAWVRTHDDKLQVDGTTWCLQASAALFGATTTIVDCANATTWTFEPHGSIRSGEHCLSPGHASRDAGAVLSLESCVAADHQAWSFQDSEMVNRATDFCATAGYAFAQAAAFVTPSGSKVIVVLNEHSEDTHFALTTSDGRAVETVVPKGGIRTYEWV